MRLVFAEPAARDLDDIIDYIALDNPPAAEKVYRTIVTATDRLQDFPRSATRDACPPRASCPSPPCPTSSSMKSAPML
ncbi:type II toxin-antitoxin system RelE/ParE family toxin [Hankyongella ginsenosidimutans]|uniref:Type II toxin-antitoxin system RelE/ParE family toxin n=1 Tax=Hankyongella ginsenosidimutans TaxID=1763828 RepID=A0A4D7C7F9_9SPHN|nr:type II toxin-antitoxin system RelE/ParE family toxin [Hankyongella ginsenosidimutans]